ncbi:MAG TPA: hypothetical protein VJ179_03295, partial [Patescibacteria group bacterium]|nr:hypothetical protein [Patescibacteria group bacterium]
MKIRRTHVFILILFLLFLCTFVAKGIILLDPDFGWRIRTGALIRKEGIPLSDPYSYTMPE